MDKPNIEFETDRLYVRPVMENDKDEYMSLRMNTSDLAAIYDMKPDFADYEWECELGGEDGIYLSVFQKEDNAFVASASVQDYDGDIIELGFDVVKEYRGKGIATELAKALVAKVHKIIPTALIQIKMRKDNIASKRVVEKCGGILFGTEDSVFTKTMDAMAKTRGGELPELDDKDKMIEKMNEGRDSVLVYNMP